MSVDEIIKDVTLRGYFFELISRNLVLGLTNTYDLKSKDYIKVHKDYYESYLVLSSKLEGLVKEKEIFDVIQEVSMHYLNKVGKIQFVSRERRSFPN